MRKYKLVGINIHCQMYVFCQNMLIFGIDSNRFMRGDKMISGPQTIIMSKRYGDDYAQYSFAQSTRRMASF
jgi:hypothetical protein